MSWRYNADFFFLSVYTTKHSSIISVISCVCVCKPSNWLVPFVVVLFKYPQQAKGWKSVPSFLGSHVLSVRKGYYVELNFTMRSDYKSPCLWDEYLEIRDGNNQAANILGVFCGDYKTAVVRSSGRYLWLRFFPRRMYNLSAHYSGKSFNQTGMIFLVTFQVKHY